MTKLFPDATVVDTRFFNVHQDWEVPIPGFFVLSPHRTLRTIMDFTDEESAEFIVLLQRLRMGMRDELGITDVYYFQNEDSEHGYHLWVFPRLPWMEEHGRKIQSVRPIMNHSKKHRVADEVKAQVMDYVVRMRDYFDQL